MPTAPTRPERYRLAPDLEISRIVTGLWQVADMERQAGRPLDPEAAAEALAVYAESGFDSFDMADHYGSAELITGRLLAGYHKGHKPRAFTKWCPEPGPMTRAVVGTGIAERLERLGVDRLDLLQLHWWLYEHPAYLDAMAELGKLRQEGLIGELGVTNFDTEHLRILIAEGHPVRTNQVSFSLLDRRAAGPLTTFCLEHGIRLLAYGTLAGGFMDERWLGAKEPATIADWSRMKYRRFIEAIGGWEAFQRILTAAGAIAEKHGVRIANVATRWVLDQPAVAAVIVGARPGERDHREANLATFAFALDAEDHARLEAAFAASRPVPGDCGDEYRRPPFLTASGDLSHHLGSLPQVFRATPDGDRSRVSSGSVWEEVAGYTRALRIGDRVLVSGTTATHGPDHVVARDDPAAQTAYVLDKIQASLRAVGAGLGDVVRTRVFVRDIAQWEPVARTHGRYFRNHRPVNSLVEAKLVGDYLVEIEAEAVVRQA
ncbi:MAG: aldo/keto reductase [Geminicoccaceae bacterium]